MDARELESAIERDLDDVERRLVYADWLQQHGDPRGELSAVQHAMKTATGAKLDELRAREQALFDTHDTLLGPLGPVFASAASDYRNTNYRSKGIDPVWRLGFLDAIRITVWEGLYDCFVDARDRWEIVQQLIPDEDDGLDVRGLLRLVAAAPAARFLRRLQFGDTAAEESPAYDLGEPGATLLDTLVDVAIPTLRSLELGAMDFRMGETERSWTRLGDVGKVLRAYPQLHDVVLAGTGEYFEWARLEVSAARKRYMRLELGAIDLPELRRFEIRTTDLHRSQLTSIVEANWPKLETLHVWFGSSDRGAECTIDDIVPLLERPYPRLTHLGLMNAELTDDLVDLLAASPLLAQLETLDLSLGCLTDDGALELRDQEPAFRHLARLVLDQSHLTERGISAVTGLCREVSVADQREPYDFMEDGRYVAAGE